MYKVKIHLMALCVTDRAGVQHRPQPSPRSRALACSHTAVRSSTMPF